MITKDVCKECNYEFTCQREEPPCHDRAKEIIGKQEITIMRMRAVVDAARAIAKCTGAICSDCVTFPCSEDNRKDPDCVVTKLEEALRALDGKETA